MPRRLLLDGDDLAALMQRVRSEMGPDAVVVKAERVRTGGVAGFFARERFEVTVEVPDPRPRSRPRPAGPAGPVGLSALLDAADAGDGAGPGDHAPGGSVPGPRVPGHDAAVPRVSTDGDTFASLLASLDDMSDAHVTGAAPGAAPAGPPRPPAARFAPHGATVTAAAFGPLGPPASPTPPAVPAAAEPDPVAPPSDPDTAAAAPAPAPAAAFAGAPPPAAPSETAPEPTPEPAPARTEPPSPGGSTRHDLSRLGVPASVLGAGAPDEPLPLSTLLGALPRPPAPVRTAGSLVVVVGEGPSALPVATALARRAGLESREVVLAGEMPPVQGHGRRLLNPAAAARHRAKAADAPTVGFVAVGVGPEAGDRAAAAALVAELVPDQTWVVVDARRKTTDLRGWLRDVAGARPVDAVAASWVHETQEPGTVLDLGAPVGWLDGLPATPVVWAAVLSERLDAGARWD